MYLPHFLPMHLFFLFISHYARIAPSKRKHICTKIKHTKFKLISNTYLEIMMVSPACVLMSYKLLHEGTVAGTDT